MNNSLATGTGITAIRHLRESPKKTATSKTTSTTTSLTWSKEQLKKYISQLGLQEIVSVLASLQADGRMLPLLCDQTMVKFAISDTRKRASFVMACKAANVGYHEFAIKWNVEQTITWLLSLQLPSINESNQSIFKKNARSNLIHGTYLCHLVTKPNLFMSTNPNNIFQILPSLSSKDVEIIIENISKHEELQLLTSAILPENDDNQTIKPNNFSNESVSMPGAKPSKSSNSSTSTPATTTIIPTIPTTTTTDDSFLNDSITMLSTPRYEEDIAELPPRPQQTLSPKDTNSLLLPKAEYLSPKPTLTSKTSATDVLSESIQFDDGFFTKVLYNRDTILGRGAFGAVYKGYDAGSGCFVAVKEITNTTNMEELRVQVQEITLLKTLIHPNVVSYLGAAMREKMNEWGTTEPVLCIATELMAGGSIGSIVSNYGPLEEGVVQTYTRDILSGLEYLHNQKIVHRDIKPDNVLISVSGIAKIGDFGESKMLGASMTAKDENLTMKGTPYFMAPEVLLEDGHGRKSDIWSVGATVLQMSTFEKKFNCPLSYISC